MPLPGSSLHGLLQSLAEYRAVPDSCYKADHVHQARKTVNPAELLVESHHLLGMRRSIIGFLAITSF